MKKLTDVVGKAALSVADVNVHNFEDHYPDRVEFLVWMEGKPYRVSCAPIGQMPVREGLMTITPGTFH